MDISKPIWVVFSYLCWKYSQLLNDILQLLWLWKKKSRKKAFASEWSWSHWGFDSPRHFQTHIHQHVVPLHAQTAPSATPEEPNLHLCVRLFIEVRSCEILVEAWWAVLVHLCFEQSVQLRETYAWRQALTRSEPTGNSFKRRTLFFVIWSQIWFVLYSVSYAAALPEPAFSWQWFKTSLA